jgi:hypothetical protein
MKTEIRLLAFALMVFVLIVATCSHQAVAAAHPLPPVTSSASSSTERTDRDVIPVRIPERELHGSSARIHVGLLLEPSDKSACPRQRRIEIIDTEKQEKTVARLRVIGARQGGMVMGAPLVKAEQDRSIGVEDLTPVVMGGSPLRQA